MDVLAKDTRMTRTKNRNRENTKTDYTQECLFVVWYTGRVEIFHSHKLFLMNVAGIMLSSRISWNVSMQTHSCNPCRQYKLCLVKSMSGVSGRRGRE